MDIVALLEVLVKEIIAAEEKFWVNHFFRGIDVTTL